MLTHHTRIAGIAWITTSTDEFLKPKPLREIGQSRLKDFKEQFGPKSYFYNNLANRTFGGLEQQYREANRRASVGAFEDDLAHIIDIIEWTSYAITPWKERAADQYKPWHHGMIEEFGPHKTPCTIDKGSLETAVRTYLDGNFRSQQFDRLFVDMLVGEEYVAFIDDPRANIDAFQKPMLRGYLAGRFNAALIVAGVWFAAFILAWLQWIGPELLLWALGLPIAFFVIGTAL
jgi:hypothetical protein